MAAHLLALHLAASVLCPAILRDRAILTALRWEYRMAVERAWMPS